MTPVASGLDRDCMADANIPTDRKLRQRIGLASLICLFIVVCCLSFGLGARDYGMAYIFYDPARLPHAAITVAAFATVALVFVFAKFSFGYLVGRPSLRESAHTAW
jgi:hypothetical protein